MRTHGSVAFATMNTHSNYHSKTQQTPGDVYSAANTLSVCRPRWACFWLTRSPRDNSGTGKVAKVVLTGAQQASRSEGRVN